MLNNSLLISNFVIDGFKKICFLLDKGVYWLSKIIYSAFYYLANATLLNDTVIANITKRIYAIIGIIMVFVLAFNLLSYIVDPDKINDKKVGASAVIKDILIALVILTTLPTIFNKLYSFQNKVLTSGVIANLILGGYSTEEAPSYDDYIANKDIEGYTSLTDYYIKNGANNMVANIYVAFLYPLDDFTVLDCDEDDGSHENYCNAYTEVKKRGNIEAFSPFITKDDYNYFPLLSTAGGVVLIFFMLSFCVNLGKRAGKMAILQLIAPIPVIMELLPNKKGTRKTWLDMLIRTYIEVFMYLSVIYIVVFLISLIPSVIGTLFANATGAGFVKIIVIIMLIFGLLLFAKEAPQMIFDILGIKSTGVIAEAAKRGLAMAGVAKNTIQGTAGNMIRGATENKGFGRITGALMGGASAFSRNLWAGRNVHSLKDAKANRLNINEGITRRRINRQAYNFEHALKHDYHGMFGGLAGHATDALGAINKGFKNRTSIDLGYQKKKEQEATFKGLKDKAKAGIMDIINNDSAYQILRDQYVRSGGNDKTAEAAMRDRIKELMKNNAEKIRFSIGDMNGYIGSHQYVDGMMDQKIDFKSLYDANGNMVLSKVFDLDTSNQIKIDADGTVSFGGDIKATLDGKDVTMTITDKNGTKLKGQKGKVMQLLKKDEGYKAQKAQEAINEKVREEARKAVQEKKNDKKN